MVTKQKLQLGGLLMASMIVHAGKKWGRERERERSEYVSIGHLKEVKHNGKL